MFDKFPGPNRANLAIVLNDLAVLLMMQVRARSCLKECSIVGGYFSTEGGKGWGGDPRLTMQMRARSGLQERSIVVEYCTS